MRLTPLTAACGTSQCPQLYLTDEGTIVVQGEQVSASGTEVSLGSGELLVQVPLELFQEAARNLRAV